MGALRFLVKIRTDEPGSATQLIECVLGLGINLGIEHLSMIISHVKGIDVGNLEHPCPGPLYHGANTSVGSRFRALRNDDVVGYQNRETPASGKMVLRVLFRSSPHSVPSPSKAGLGLASGLTLVKFVLLDKYDINSLSA